MDLLGPGRDLDIDHPAPRRRAVAPFWLGFAVLAAPAAWSIEELINFSISSPACYPKDHPLGAPAFGGVIGALTALQVVVFAIGLTGLIVSIICWMRTRDEGGGGSASLIDRGDGRTRFIAMCAVMLSAGFVVAMIFVGVALVLVSLC